MRGHRIWAVAIGAATITVFAVAPASSTQAAARTYAGPLYSVSEKVGDNPRVLTHLLPGMKRNGVRTAVLYFGIESRRDVAYVEGVLTSAPGAVVPFYSTGIGGKGEGRLAGARLVRGYQAGYDWVVSAVGKSVMRGIGEVEIYAWDMPHDDARVRLLVDFAAQHDLAVMLHPRAGSLDELDALVAGFPRTTFLIHMFTLDFERDRDRLISLMSSHPNVFYTVDVDHLLLDQSGPFPVGLLYKYAGLPTRAAVKAFVAAFDAGRDALLATAVARYRPLVVAHPDRIMWGTEMSLDYTYDRAVYDRMIDFSRAWMAELPLSAQAGVAHRNAMRVLGSGVTLP